MADHADVSDLHPEDDVIQTESERFLLAQATVGADVELFLNSDAGRYLKGVAVQEIGDAVRVFLNHDTHRSIDQVAEAHTKAHRARQSFLWMLEAIQAGRVADYSLRQMDDAEER